MRRWLIPVIAAILGGLAPRAARAGGALEELSAGRASEGSHWIGDKLAAIWDIDAGTQLRLDVSATRMYDGTGAATGQAYLGSLSVAYSTDDHWSLRLSGAWTPESTTSPHVSPGDMGSMPDRTVLGQAMLSDADLRITSSSLAFGAGLDYDSASDDMHSLSASLSFSATYFHAQQEIISAHTDGDGEELDPVALRARCVQLQCDSQATAALWPQWVQLGQFSLGASVTDTIGHDTDLSLDAAYYLYDRDPAQSGYHALSTLADSTLGSATSAPLLREALSPSVAHRWGAVSATASLSYADYADSPQSNAPRADLGASLRVQYKVALAGSQRLKLYVKLAASTQVAQDDRRMNTNSAGLGAQYSW